MAIRAVERISIPTLALGLDYRLQAVNIEDGALADAENFWFEGADVLTKRPGIVPVGDNLPLNGTPLHIDQFYKSSGASWLICITTTSVYYYDENKREWVDISPEGGLSGTDRDLISADIIHDTFIFTNGVDPVMQWDGLAPRVTALPGAAAALAAVGGRAALVTSASRELALLRLRAAGLTPPAVLVAADDISQGKPDPEPYLLAAHRLGVEPSRCLVVEDAPAGLESARDAGAATLAVTTTSRREQLAPLADLVVDDLSAVELVPVASGVRVRLVRDATRQGFRE